VVIPDIDEKKSKWVAAGTRVFHYKYDLEPLRGKLKTWSKEGSGRCDERIVFHSFERHYERQGYCNVEACAMWHGCNLVFELKLEIK
jgi:hypothetical protein